MNRKFFLMILLGLSLVAFAIVVVINPGKPIDTNAKLNQPKLTLSTIEEIYSGEIITLSQLMKDHSSKGIVFYIDVPGTMDFEWNYVQEVYEKSKEYGYLSVAIMLNHQSRMDTQRFFQQSYPEGSFPFVVGIDSDENIWKQELAIGATPQWLIVNEQNEIQLSEAGVGQHTIDSIDSFLKQ